MRFAEKGEIQLCGTLKTLEEFRKVLRYSKFGNRLKRLEVTYNDVVDLYEDLLELYVELYEDLEFDTPIVIEDPDDDSFVCAALVSGAGFIVSGDGHLLNLREYAGIRIVRAGEFLMIRNS